MREEDDNDHLQRSDAGKALWFFQHIPKTAGSSFGSAVADKLKPNYNINIEAVRGTMGRDAAFKNEIEKFVGLDKEQQYSFASGHLKMNEVMTIRDAIGRPMNLITILREPAKRVVSEYRYQRTPVHSAHEQFLQEYPTFESYLNHPRSQNKMFRHLALREETLQATIRRLEEEFAIVGVVEMYPPFIKECSRLMGINIVETTRLRVTSTTQDSAINLTGDLMKKIRELNSQDDELWRHFRDRMRSMRTGGASRTFVPASKPPTAGRPAGATPAASPARRPNMQVKKNPPPAPRQARPDMPARDPQTEIARLKRENERLRSERDALQKSLAIFVKTQG